MSQHYQAPAPRRRQQLFRPDEPLHGCGLITSLDSLRSHLQTAIEIEHSTIPTYLTTLYTINPITNAFAYQTIQSVVMEEMLHMTLAANIMNAIGGHPAVNTNDFIPEYPTYLPHSDDAFLVPLQKFCKDTVDVFLKIEKPAHKFVPPEFNNYKTIGQFYKAVKYGLRYWDHVTPGGIFTGDKSLQVTCEQYYGGGGKLTAVYSLSDAVLAINEIVGQGEGMDGTIEDPDQVFFGEDVEYAHYYKFNEIRHERRYRPEDTANCPPTGRRVHVDWDAAINMHPNPKMKDYPVGSPLYNKTLDFNQSYMRLLTCIHDAFNGQPDLLMKAVPLMYDLKYKALDLLNLPLGNGEMAGPSFEYVAI